MGPGGFIDIAQNAKKVVFCGTFDTKGSEIHTGWGELKILKPGKICKFVESVDQITFSGEQALIQGQEVLYVTERAVFSLKKDGIELIEIAPGIEIVKDILSLMKFKPLISRSVQTMNTNIFIDIGNA